MEAGWWWLVASIAAGVVVVAVVILFLPRYSRRRPAPPAEAGCAPTGNREFEWDSGGRDESTTTTGAVREGSPPQYRDAKIIPVDPEIVNFNAFAPKEIVPGSSFQLDIWIHKAIDYKEVRERSFLLGRDQLVGCRNGVPVQRGKGLQVQVSIQGMTVVDPVDELCWYGSPANLTFHVKVPSRCRLGEHMGKAVISYQGLPVARLAFAVWVSRVPDQRVGPCSTSLFYPDTAFASYAEKDSEAVLGRIQGMKAVRPDIDIFVDVMSLRSGDLWRKELEHHVPGKDAFLLFWSAHAAQSKWVDYEWRLALQKRGLDYIHPIPLTQPPHRPIPQELQELHFRNMELVVAQGLRASGLN